MTSSKRFTLSLADALRRMFRRRSGVAYWETRAEEHGRRSVLNLAHTAEEIESVTQRQLDILMPLLRSSLRGDERLAIDFGCGTGRFSGALAEAIGGRVLAVDPIARLLDLAPPHPQVEYRRIHEDIPLDSGAADLVWVCLVLGTIVDERSLRHAASEIERVLKPGGLLFLVENTAKKRDMRHFKFRSEAEYAALFPRVGLHAIGGYDDAGERISVLAGRNAQDRLRPAKMEILSPRSS